ncbi:MAG: GNAT family N-acetyltransferase [Anaerolineae bacterium]|nr:GNAT family N-acetyltransferase [Anaerolineae bacterium]
MTPLERAAMILEIPVTFRTANRIDVDKLEWYGQFTHFRNLLRRAYREQLRGRRLMLVADFNGFPIGQVFIQYDSMNELIADGWSRGYFYSFRVMEMFQGKGIGTRLLYEAESVLVERGYQFATLSVALDNPRAFQLYQRNGYEVIGQDPGRWHYVDDLGVTRYVEEPCWILEKALSID